MLIEASTTTPVGGAALDQVLWLSVVAGAVSLVLLFIAWQHRTHRIEWFQRFGDFLHARMGEPGWAAIPVFFVASSLIVALLGFLWDVSLHAGRGRDEGPLANPAHYFILYGLFALFIAGMSAVVYSRDGVKPGIASVKITRQWYAPVAGIYIAACGLYALIGFPLDDVWHRLFGQDVTLWGPTHLMLIGGAGLSTAGIIILRREAEFSMDYEDRGGLARFLVYGAAFGGLLIGLSVFQAEFDFGIAQFRMVFAPLMIVAAAGITLVAARLFVGPGAALFAAAFFLGMRGLVAFIVGPVLGQADHVFPLYLGCALLVELLALSRLRENKLAFGAAAGLLIGTVGLAIEKVWNDQVFDFPWTSDIYLEGLLMAVPVAIGAGMCGALFAMGLLGELPSRAVSRTVVTLSVLVVSGAVANGLYATVPDGATATFTTTQVGTPDDPQILTEVVLSEGLVDDNPTWVQITAWQGGGEGIVTDNLRRSAPDTYESTRPVPIGGTWKTLLRVQDGRTLTAAPIYLSPDEAIGAEELPVEATMTREFIPEIEILQRERDFDAPAWLWGLANFVVLLCSLAVITGVCVSVARVSGRIAALEKQRDAAADRDPVTG
ncbi:hypothetical protein HMPREF0063_11718 [Aeromicrobium marinum DSM 15272]|uniref:Uncharacterized protein n=1 Tax=Aeromicrobium marinum DSM 15272 TaxID=585531 RepID=E2SDD2_9ACTN|nr:hypothetical protein [Aeromicrobium marinum]EFQ82509.1 hypothetical protein HMPREF0063_11718 [Aeromicrobium marinum DSM 15272]